MRVLQLIDSLRPGGAEKMAVNIANALLPHIDKSFLCCTRLEGFLKGEIRPQVDYLFLNKKSSIALQALYKLKIFIRENKIEIVHAHGTSYFWAVLLKLLGLKFKLVWHIHNGANDNLPFLEKKVLLRLSLFFDGVIVVNSPLKNWAIQNLSCQNIIEVRNFISEDFNINKQEIKLKGNKDAFKIICVANVRPEKDHLNLIKAFEKLDPSFNISLHLVGADPGTIYSSQVFDKIENSFIEGIYYYGARNDVFGFLQQADVGILASKFEGLPLALLEYGIAGLPVISTNVGQCKELVGNSGLIVPANNCQDLANSIIFYYQNPSQRIKDAGSFQQKILKNYSKNSVLSTILNFYSKL